jgi:amino acid adenylation domain-containing protein
MQQELVEGFQLAPQQKRLWLLQAGGRAFESRCEIEIDGTLDRAALKAAAGALVRRHEILRTSFDALPGMRTPVQLVSGEREPAWSEVELSGLEAAARAAELRRAVRGAAIRPDDFAGGALVRFTLCTLSADRSVLVVSLPSLCADTRTLKNLFAELADAYASQLAGEEASEEAVQYVQFSEWQNELFEAEDGGEGRGFWRQQATAEPAELVLPCELRPAGRTAYAPACFTLTLAPESSAAVEAASRGASPREFMLACYQTVLWRLTRQTDITTGVLCDGRVYEEMAGAFGLYERWPAVRTRFEEGYRFDELLGRAGEALRQAEEWQEYYLSETREPEHAAPGFAFDFGEWPAARAAGAACFSVKRLHACTDRFKLRLSCVRRGDSLAAEFHYDEAYYTRETIERFAGQFETALAHVARYGGATVGKVSVVGEAERRRMLYELNERRVEYPRGKTVSELFEAQAAATPEAVAVVHENEQLTYAELNGRANRLARHLRTLGVGPEVRVGLYMERSASMLVGLLGILKAGGAYVPLDLAQPSERLATMLADARAHAVVTQQSLSAALPAHDAEVVRLDSDRETIARHDAADFDGGATDENLVYVIYTSGSAGRPKGVMIRHRSAANLAAALRAEVYAGVETPLRVSLNAPLAFDSSVKQVLQLLSGHALHVVPEEARLDGAALLAFVRERRLDVLDCTPSQLRLLLAAGLCAQAGHAPSRVLVGGEAIDEATWKTLRNSPRTHFHNVYGPTECTVDATACGAGEGPPSPSIGRALAGVRAYVLDEGLGPVPFGVAGELHVGGEGVGRGYLDLPALTAERFMPDPFGVEPGARLYRTGDLVRQLPDGRFEFLGRKDFQVKIRGFRIELEEIESVIAEQESVRQVVVAAREHPSGDKYLAAYVVPERGQPPTKDELRAAMRRKLPEHMVPFAFVLLDKLPLTPNGKVDRRALPAPDNARPELSRAYVAPRGEVEEEVARIWAEVLDLKQVGVHDNFFDLGGHSLLVTQVISRVRETFRMDIPLRSLFEANTVAGLSEIIEQAKRAGASAAPAIKPLARDSYRVKLSAQGTPEIPRR